MTDTNIQQALEDIYTSLNNDNEDIDARITTLKSVLSATGQKDVVVDSSRLPQNNRQGRKLMQSYFKKRGIQVSFTASA